MNKNLLYRSIPKVDILLEKEEIQNAVEEYGREIVMEAIREEMEGLRAYIGTCEDEKSLTEQILRYVKKVNTPNMRMVINGTGTILHTNLGRAPISQEHMTKLSNIVTGYSNLEYNLEAGKQLGEYARTFLNKDSQIAIVSHVKGVSTAIEREQGFREGLGDYNKNVVDVVYCNSQFDKASELTEELMKKYPDLEMIAGMNEYSSVGAARAVQRENMENQIQVVGVDSSQEAVQLMEKGVFKGIVVQKAFKMGYLGVTETVRMLQGKPYDENVNSGCQLVTPENMYSSEIEKLIFPFNTIKQTL